MCYLITIISITILLISNLYAIPEKEINKKWDKKLSNFMKANGKKGYFKGERESRINHFQIKGNVKKVLSFLFRPRRTLH